MNFFSKIRRFMFGQRIPVLRLNGFIDQKMTQRVQMALSKLDPKEYDVLAVVVNSPGGSPVQADIITKKLQHFCQSYNLPLYMFAEELAISCAYYVLCSGDKIFADYQSLIGSIGKDSKFLGLEEYKNGHNNSISEIKNQNNPNTPIKYQFTNNMDVWFRKFENFEYLTQEESQMMQSFQDQHHQKFLDKIKKIRKNKMQVTNDMIGQIYLGVDAQKLGLVDGIGTYHQVLSDDYPSASIAFISQQSFKQVFQSYMKKCLQIIQQVNSRRPNMNKVEEQFKN